MLRVVSLSVPVSILTAVITTWPVVAMNQEGHDGFMKDFPPGVEAFGPGPGQFPLPSPMCPVTAAMAKANPYEQIPLQHHGCPTEANGTLVDLRASDASANEGGLKSLPSTDVILPQE